MARWNGKRRYTAQHRPPELPRCRECRKLLFPTQQAAQDELLECMIKKTWHNEPWRKERRVYECPGGDGFHLTAMPEERRESA